MPARKSFRRLTARKVAVSMTVAGLLGFSGGPAVGHARAAAATSSPGEETIPGVAVRLDDYRLPDAYGKDRDLGQLAGEEVTVVLVLGVECPLARLYGPRLEALAKAYADQPVAFVGVNANRQDSLTDLQGYANRHGVTFPLLKDNAAEVIAALDATRTPEAFVVTADGLIAYRGRIDDQYAVGGVVRDAPTREFLREAIDAALAGDLPETRSTEAVGCLIGKPPTVEPADAAVTYSEHVAPVLNKHCVECHRPGEIGPFHLTEYDEAAGWADMIAEVVEEQRMPPWHAADTGRALKHVRGLTAAEKQTLYDWAAAGAPQGDPSLTPPTPEFVAGWRLPSEPDVVLTMRDTPFTVPAQGVVDYQYFAVDPGFTEDRWVQAADIQPGDPSVVHHVIVFISPSADRPSRGLGWLGAYVPGQGSMRLPEGQARLIPAGSKLIFQMHYTPTGVETDDLTRMGLVFADEAGVEEEVVTLLSANPKFEIPPGDPDFRVSSSQAWFPGDAKLIGVAPHMHFRGKTFRMTGVWPDGREELLLDVPRYDFNWQTNYRFVEPVTPPPGFRIDCDAAFDNSAQNPFNPDPTIPVRWGDQSFEEMMVAFFEVAAPRGSLDRYAEQRAATNERHEQEARRLTDALFEKHDNGDGVLSRNELPDAFAIFAFARYDLNNDKRLTVDEVYEAALADETSRF